MNGYVADIFGSYRLEGANVKSNGLPHVTAVVSGNELCRRMFRRELKVFGSRSSTLIRSYLIREHGPFYHESFLHADTEL